MICFVVFRMFNKCLGVWHDGLVSKGPAVPGERLGPLGWSISWRLNQWRGGVCVGGGASADRCCQDKRVTNAHAERLQRNICQLMWPGWGCWSRGGFFPRWVKEWSSHLWCCPGQSEAEESRSLCLNHPRRKKNQWLECVVGPSWPSAIPFGQRRPCKWWINQHEKFLDYKKSL